MAEVRCYAADLVEYMKVECYAGFMGNRKKVQHAVGRTAQRHITSDRVADRLFVDDVTRSHTL